MSPTRTTTRPRPPARGAAGERSGRQRRPIDPRISARRTAVTREQGRRRLRVVTAGLIGTVLLVVVWLVLFHTPLFAARAVTVVGATHQTPAEIVQQAGLAGHPPLMRVNAGAAAHAVEALPWVRSATVSVHWPDGVRIVVHEEVPRLVMALPGGKFAEVALDGRVLAVTPTAPTGLLPFAAPAVPTVAGSTLGAKDEVGLLIASTLPPSFAAQVTGITVEPAGWVQLGMTTPILINLGDGTQLNAKYEDVSALLSGATLHNGDILDVSVPRSPTVTGP
jgi:cell division septal protein FtsQ